jgi:flavin reductase (DIM6/NTAB) family NADH-FMN oxidoreductase RutF
LILDPNAIDHRDRYKLLIGAVLPRPIAWVSSMDADGRLNLAPFSYFTIVCPTPMTLVFCPGVHPDGRKKDTWRNIEQVPEFVINVTNEDTAAQMNLCATVLPSGESEYDWAGVTPIPSETIRVPRVAEAPIAFECVLDRLVTVSDQPGGGAAIFGRVQSIYVRDDLLDEGRIDPAMLKPIGRMAGDLYTRTTDLFSMQRVAPPEMSPTEK